ncbi:hypothetical protein DENIS_1819 [Desulfonema ishimotonii]|uniref:PilZ domain-containing protein n=1 Tax=Desulfonema ishimotonii TaxID=45657 RepID=A0A401FV67_9BACT|nr:hypothetical protein [Desulfonema ishimotonii]GBC60860.1 hypothetical protein DENIS_1819 [Desulfonema ishimotonii]
MNSEMFTERIRGLFFLRQQRVCSVCWDGLLEVRFPDFRTRMPVRGVDLSGSGACFCCEQIFVHQRYLTSVAAPVDLILKIRSPSGGFETPSEITWYRWSVEKRAYEIAVKFVNMLAENRKFLDKLISELRNRKGVPHET